MKLRKASIIRTVIVSAIALVALSVIGVEWMHYHNYGHLVSYGLHVDPLHRDAYIGIPGQTKMYYARLSNYSLWPVSLPACDYVTDDFGKGTEFPYAVQRWEASSNRWQTIVDMSAERFCQPYPLGMIETHLVTKKLWPGSSVEVMEGEATGAHDSFRKGDLARFVVFRKMDSTGDWHSAIPSEPFPIQDDVIRTGNESFRLKH
ncbi:MAG: hypothetical protein ACREBG_14055 [Pyrinomonadaceae bacterium]